MSDLIYYYIYQHQINFWCGFIIPIVLGVVFNIKTRFYSKELSMVGFILILFAVFNFIDYALAFYDHTPPDGFFN